MFIFQELHIQLKKQFNLNEPVHPVDDNVVIHTFPFESKSLKDQSSVLLNSNFDDSINSLDLFDINNNKNQYFRYSVFEPVKRQDRNRAILLLHGLNERSWEKYLSWAYVLALETGIPVILFPLANHINRSPISWSVPRQMIKVVGLREKSYGKIRNSTFVNAALSERMDLVPELFVYSGIQSVADLVTLSQQIIRGKHPLFNAGTAVDFFSYSIGAFVTEVLLLSNPFNLYDDSRAFFFCGGSTFDQMDGRSRTILDDRAFERLKTFLLQTDFSALKRKFPGFLMPVGEMIWDAFTSVISLERFRKKPVKTLQRVIQNIKAIGLKKDLVIPGEAIYKTLKIDPKSNVRVIDFDFSYSHEAPFPIANNAVSWKVDRSFKNIFNEASGYFLDRS
ncbi:DUF6051 family protein [Thermophagus xiamenensis]|uniref:Alpha/beta hydrolase n=1 Tax=Thermophagus xiamenensis TaxID=385682 RepID=A0A1I1VER3_9BACT|nr:DUF6051 family protein [Thermophagus xiamenensis]SFD81487.1 hypothetical protein SAMN05444380_102153 [Thermophagus xiamenensis]